MDIREKIYRLGRKNFNAVQSHTFLKKSQYRRYIKRISHRLAERCYAAVNGVSGSSKSSFSCHKNAALLVSAKERNRKLFMSNPDDFLTVDGVELEILAEGAGIDHNLPTKQKQEQVFKAMSDLYTDTDTWKKEEIARKKKHFLDTLEKSHFINLTCSILQIDESLVRSWIKVDNEFALAVRASQVRFGERVAHSVLVQALNGDMAAAMYVMKEFKDVVSFVDPQVEDAELTTQDDITKNLSPEEQQLLISLIQKAKQNTAQINGQTLPEADTSELRMASLKSSAAKFGDLEYEDLDDTSLLEQHEEEIDPDAIPAPPKKEIFIDTPGD